MVRGITALKTLKVKRKSWVLSNALQPQPEPNRMALKVMNEKVNNNQYFVTTSELRRNIDKFFCQILILIEMVGSMTIFTCSTKYLQVNWVYSKIYKDVNPAEIDKLTHLRAGRTCAFCSRVFLSKLYKVSRICV
jgi:hypothetical protein